MPHMELNWLILVQIGIETILVLVLVFLLRRLRQAGRAGSVQGAVEVFESVLQDADRIAGEFRTQLEEKQRLIGRLNRELDRRIIHLNLLLNGASALRTSGGGLAPSQARDPLGRDPGEVIRLAEQGLSPERIARELSIPKAEVQLILEIKRRSARLVEGQGEA